MRSVRAWPGQSILGMASAAMAWHGMAARRTGSQCMTDRQPGGLAAVWPSGGPGCGLQAYVYEVKRAGALIVEGQGQLVVSFEFYLIDALINAVMSKGELPLIVRGVA